MSVYLITTGTSIHENLQNYGRDQWAIEVLTYVGEQQDPGPRSWPQITFDPRPQVVATITTQDFNRDDDGTDRALSAELASLFADGAPQPDEGDLFVLVSSDTTLGERCARMVAGRLVGPDSGAAVLVSGQDGQRSIVEAGNTGAKAIVVRVGGLLPDENLAASQAFANLAWTVLGAASLATLNETSLIVHPTGGFKATIPVFVTLLGLLPRPFADLDLEMWTNHERTTKGIRLPLLRLGGDDDLRATIVTDLNTIKDHVSGANEPTLISRTQWKGILWEQTNGGLRLTPFGEAILAVLQ